MSKSFDPYHNWLAIPPNQQPPNLYQLLGVQLFESDPAVIQSACKARLMNLQVHQNGSRGASCQQLMREIREAHSILTSPTKRAGYDAKLKQQFAPAEIVEGIPVYPPAGTLPPAGYQQPYVAYAPTGNPVASYESSNSTNPILYFAFGGCAAVLLLAVAGVAVAVTLFLNRPPTQVADSRAVDAVNSRSAEVVDTESFEVDDYDAVAKLESIDDLPVKPGRSVDFQVKLVDSSSRDYDLRYSVQSGPPGATINRAGIFHWQSVDADANKVIPVTLRVANSSGRYSEQKFKIHVGDRVSIPERPSVAATPSAPVTPSAATPSAAATPSVAATLSVAATAEKQQKPKTDLATTKIGDYALRFDCKSNVELAGTQGLVLPAEEFTVELWVRAKMGRDGGFSLIGDFVSGNKHPEVRHPKSAGFYFGVGRTTGNTLANHHVIHVQTGGPLGVDENTWYHLAAVNESDGLSIYIDGKLWSRKYSRDQTAWNPSPVNLFLGTTKYKSPVRDYVVDIRDVRISSICRYRTNFEPPKRFTKDADTEVLLDFTRSGEKTLDDLSGNMHLGEINGASWIEISETADVEN